MYTHIMNNPVAMANLKERNGLTVRTNTNAASEYIKSKRIMRELKEEWQRIKKSFEDTYSNCKRYDFLYIKSFIGDIEVMTPGRLDKLHKAAINHELEDYLLRHMEINKENLVFRNSQLTA
jgi:hypothetical protein